MVLITAAPDLKQTAGSVPIKVGDGDREVSLEGRSVRARLDAPPKMRPGQRGTATVTLTGLEGLRGLKTERFLKVQLTNATPDVIALEGKQVSKSWVVNTKQIRPDGTYQLKVPFTALRVGTFMLLCSVRQSAFCCDVTCSPCHVCTWWEFSCDNKGFVACGRGNCDGACIGHSGASSCDCWFCSCPFKFCVCKDSECKK